MFIPSQSQKVPPITLSLFLAALNFRGHCDPFLLHSILYFLISGSKWWTQVSSCLKMLSKKFSGSLFIRSRFLLQILTRFGLSRFDNIFGTHRAESFLHPISSCKILCTGPWLMFAIMLISATINRRSFSTSFRMGMKLSIVVTTAGRPNLGASWMLLSPRFYSDAQFATVEYAGALPLCTAFNAFPVCLAFWSFLSEKEDQFSPIFALHVRDMTVKSRLWDYSRSFGNFFWIFK